MNKLSRLDKLRASMTFAVIAAITIVSVSAAHAQSTVGTITRVSGIVNVNRGGATLAAIPHLPVQLHDKIVSEPNGSATITMVDNSSLRLGEQSTLTIDESTMIGGVGAPTKVGLLGGTMHSLIVGAMRGSSTTFEVHTPNAVGAVRGTEWDTSYSEGVPRPGFPGCSQFTDVAVQDGVVNVLNPAGSVDVHAGNSTTVACTGAPTGQGGAAAGVGIGAAAAGAALGAGVIGGAVFGGLEASGAFDNNKPKPPKTPKN